MNNSTDTVQSDSTEIKQLVESVERTLLNETAIRQHALRCSKSYRAGKFTRVGSEFVDELKADVDAILFKLRGECDTLHPALGQDKPLPGSMESDPEIAFVKGALLEKFESELNRWIARKIQNKVQKQPSVGCTLARTR